MHEKKDLEEIFSSIRDIVSRHEELQSDFYQRTELTKKIHHEDGQVIHDGFEIKVTFTAQPL
ncbi:hypothetical protein [Facklamia hominis]|uniref:Uncharacterized protein n=1 Tax=Facklamia hominis CCUG 36813 TaxID=883111 RepID=K1LQW3_9LACT|nr:hypothetical protein [Facklamia hominis]EKB54507.1 hypothetical protein HMPREF9706_00697 [Facklamia hominis CCUG 36813]